MFVLQSIITAWLCLLCSAQSIEEILERINVLEHEVKTTLAHINRQDDALNSLGDHMSVMSASLHGMVADNQRINDDVSQSKSHIEGYQDKYVNIPTAFSATATTPEEVNNATNIQFTNALTNYGYHYNSEASTYTCAHYGLYMFTTTLFTGGPFTAGGQIMIGSTPLSIAYSCDSTRDDQATAVAFGICDVGQQVTVQAWGSNGALDGDTENGFTSFSGGLLLKL